MHKLTLIPAALAALIAVSTGCAESETPAPAVTLKPPATSTVFSPLGDDDFLPAEKAFVPDAHVEDHALLFRIQMPPGYYLYKDKIAVRSLSEGFDLQDLQFNEEINHSETVTDEWFGEQEVFFSEVHGIARMTMHTAGTAALEVELSYQGCKQDGICYLPQAKVLSVDLPVQLESAADSTE